VKGGKHETKTLLAFFVSFSFRAFVIRFALGFDLGSIFQGFTMVDLQEVHQKKQDLLDRLRALGSLIVAFS